MRRRAWRTGLLSLVLALAVLLTACMPVTDSSAGDTDSSPFVIRPQNDKFLREDEWVRMMALAISHADQRDNIWEAIPPSQRSEISQADFIRYIAFLVDCLPGNISSFAAASEEEGNALLSHLAKSEKQLTPKPDQASIWWIRARTSDLRELSFAIPVTLDEEGVPYFSASWLQRQALLYDYILLYLQALATGSKGALTSLLSHNLTIKTKTRKQAVERRADDLLEFYGNQVNPAKGGYRCVEMMPGYALIEEQLTSTEPGSPKVRTVVFTESEGIFRAEEKIGQKLMIQDGIFFQDNQTLFDSHQDEALISSDTSLAQLGIPLNLELLEDEVTPEVNFRVSWPGLIVEAVGSCDLESLTFEGRIRQISISHSGFRTGSGLKPGDSVYELYLRYPFARENGYLIALNDEGPKKTLAVQVESDYIARISLILGS